jgi:hypothetical protein
VTLKKVLGCLGSAVLFLAVALTGLWMFLNVSCAWGLTELSRSPNPSGTLDAVIIQANGGATTTYVTEVYIKRAKRPVMTDDIFGRHDPDLIFSSDYADKLSVRWLDDNNLLVTARKARVYRNDKTKTLSDGKTRRTVSIEYRMRTDHLFTEP